MVDAAAHGFGLLHLIAEDTADVNILAELGSTDNRAVVGAVVDVALGLEVTALLGTAHDTADGRLVLVANTVIAESNGSVIGAAGDGAALVVTNQATEGHHTVDGR